MKISPLLGAVNFLNLVRPAGIRGNDRAHKDGGGEREQYSRHQEGDEGENSDSSRRDRQPPFSEEIMNEAVESFHTDPHAQASGLSAVAEGVGPGLRVVVKDSQGGVVRQFTGEEFLRLRDAVAQGKKNSGKLFDQKF